MAPVQPIIDNLRQLHIIRGLAALYVAIGHAKVVLWSGGQAYLDKFPREAWSISDYLVFGIDMMSSAAQEFVIVFFVLSGFFIAYSFDKNKWNLKGFFANRLIRIYPPYLFSVLLAVAIFILIGTYHPYLFSGEIGAAINNRMANSWNELNLETIGLSLIYLPNVDYIAGNFSYWSLFPEWMFYLTIPFLLRPKRWALLAFTGLYITGQLITFSANHELLMFLFEYGLYFYLGVNLFGYLDDHNWTLPGGSKWLMFGLVIISFFSTVVLGTLEIEPWSDLMACLFSMISIITLLKYPLKRTAFFKLGTFLGDISYTLYVCHLPILYGLYALVSAALNQYVFYQRIYWLAIPIVIGLSYIFYLMIESRSLTVIKKLKEQRKVKNEVHRP